MSVTSSTQVITLGTAGGPRFWGDAHRSGIATAIVTPRGYYLVDCGQGVGRQIARAGLDVGSLQGIFLTHLHSDHTIDLSNLALFSLTALQHRRGHPVPIIGPGDRGVLPPVSPRAAAPPQPFFPQHPTPGTTSLFHGLMQAYATDVNDRILDSLRPSPLELFSPQDIDIPPSTGYHPNENPTPSTEPWEVFRDDDVVVSAILVKHPPMAPAFAFRFDTPGGSVVISGDTAYTGNLVRLAQGADLLLHEALDVDFMERQYRTREDDTARASLEHHRKSHSSVSDAIRVAEAAGVPQLALHHLVPGTASADPWLEAGSGFRGTLLVPDDLDVLACRCDPLQA